MKNFPIDINGVIMYFDDISKFRKRTSKWDTIAYIAHKTGCEKEEAEQVANEIDQILFPQRVPVNTKSCSETANHIVTCPYCRSTNVTKIGVLSRTTSFSLFGLGSGKVGKQWHCKNCNSDF